MPRTDGPEMRSEIRSPRPHTILFCLLLALAALALPQGAEAARVRDIRMARHENFDRCVIELDSEPQYSCGNSSRNNGRVSIILTRVGGAPSGLPSAQGLEFITGTQLEYKLDRETMILHLNVSGPAQIQSEVIPNPWRLVVDVYAETQDVPGGGTISPVAAPPSAARIAPKASSPVGGFRPRVIVIDPGHGGHHRGGQGKANGRQIEEAELTLPIAQELYRLLNQDPQFRPVITRTKDVYVGLRERTKVAEQNRGDLFVSIHFNAVSSPSSASRARGLEFYTWSAREADKTPWQYLVNLDNEEGGSSIRNDAMPVLNQMLRDALESQSTESARVAKALERSFLTDGYFRAHYRGMKDARFKVLENYDMPSVLVEVAFITNPDEAKVIVQSAFQKKTARLLYEGIRQYYLSHDPAFGGR